MLDTLSGTQIPPECLALAQTLNAKNLPMTDQLRRLLGLPPGASPSGPASGPAGPPAVPANPPGAGQVPGGLLANDPTLGGILRSTS
jgi:phospholipid/cholesterol/gamma-HCH transport system substrate-binding protein